MTLTVRHCQQKWGGVGNDLNENGFDSNENESRLFVISVGHISKLVLGCENVFMCFQYQSSQSYWSCGQVSWWKYGGDMSLPHIHFIGAWMENTKYNWLAFVTWQHPHGINTTNCNSYKYSTYIVVVCWVKREGVLPSFRISQGHPGIESRTTLALSWRRLVTPPRSKHSQLTKGGSV